MFIYFRSSSFSSRIGHNVDFINLVINKHLWSFPPFPSKSQDNDVCPEKSNRLNGANLVWTKTNSHMTEALKTDIMYTEEVFQEFGFVLLSCSSNTF